MRRLLGMAVALGVAPAVCMGGVVLSFTRDGQPLAGPGGVNVVEGETHEIDLWMTNLAPATSALSAYQLDFQAGDFATGKLDASGWRESSAFAGLTPLWLPDDQSLDTRNGNFRVSGVTGSLSTPFVGPALPFNTATLIGSFDVSVDAPAGTLVDFVLAAGSGIDDEMGRLAGAGIVAFGINDVLVVPEPGSLGIVVAGAALALARGRRRSAPRGAQ